jgi:hypothetical protein
LNDLRYINKSRGLSNVWTVTALKASGWICNPAIS